MFNYPGTYWDAASIIVKYLLDENGGSLDGKKIALLYHNSAYGKEPIRTLEVLAEKHGFTFTAHRRSTAPARSRSRSGCRSAASGPTTC